MKSTRPETALLAALALLLALAFLFLRDSDT